MTTVLFSADEIARIASWQSIHPGFDRDESTVNERIRPILDAITANAGTAFYIVESGGLANYFAFFVYQSFDAGSIGGTYQQVEGINVYLSLLAPVGVFGKSEASFGPDSFAWGPLDIPQLLDPRAPPNPLAALVVEAVSKSDYRLLSRAAVDVSLPAGVQPYEYCLSAEPWDRLYHAMFANTD